MILEQPLWQACWMYLWKEYPGVGTDKLASLHLVNPGDIERPESVRHTLEKERKPEQQKEAT